MVFSRSSWAARPAHFSMPVGQVGLLFVHHEGDGQAAAKTYDESVERMQNIQSVHMNGDFVDIAYSFCVSDAGIFEGRGWGIANGATYQHGADSYAVCWLGDGTVEQPSERVLRYIREVYDEGISRGWLTPAATILGHKDVNATACPGPFLYDQLDAIRQGFGEDDDVTNEELQAALAPIYEALGVLGYGIAAIGDQVDAIVHAWEPTDGNPQQARPLMQLLYGMNDGIATIRDRDGGGSS